VEYSNKLIQKPSKNGSMSAQVDCFIKIFMSKLVDLINGKGAIKFVLFLHINILIWLWQL
jgi:hypothetical protein